MVTVSCSVQNFETIRQPTDRGVMAQLDFATFEFKKNVGRIFYIAQQPLSVIMTWKRSRDVVLTSQWRYYCVVYSLGACKWLFMRLTEWGPMANSALLIIWYLLPAGPFRSSMRGCYGFDIYQYNNTSSCETPHIFIICVMMNGSFIHQNDVIISAMASQITSLTSVYSTVYSGADQRKHQGFASLAFERGINRWPVNSAHKVPVTRKYFHLMTSSYVGCTWLLN